MSENIKLSTLKPKKVFLITFGIYMVIGMHFFMHNVGGYGLYIPSNILGWIFIGIMIGAGFWQTVYINKIRITFFAKIILLGFLFLLVPFFYGNNEHAGRTLFRFFSIAGGILYYISLTQFNFSKKEKSLILFLILIGVLFESIFAIFQYYNLAPKMWYGYEMDQDYPSGIFQQRNLMASFLSTGSAICLYLLLNGSNMFEGAAKKGVVYIIPLLNGILLYHLNSKTGYIGLFLATVFLLITKNWKRAPILLWFIVFFCGITFGILTQREIPTVEQRIGKSEKRIRSVDVRKARFETTFQLWTNNPIIGVGYGNFARFYRDHHAYRRANEINFQKEEGYVDHPHNELLFWLAEGGIMPFFGLILVAGAWIIMIIRMPLKDSLCFLGIILPIIVHTQVEFPFYQSLVHWIVFLTLAYLPDQYNSDSSKYSFKHIKMLKIPAVILPSFIFFYMITTLQTAMTITKFEQTGYKNPEIISKVWNRKVWHLRYEVNIMNMNLDIGFKTGNVEILQQYVNWGRNFVLHSPFLYIYYDMASALRAMGKKDESWKLIKEARYLYPDTEWIN